MKTDKALLELVRETSCSLPEDVERALRRALRAEKKGSPAATVIGTILDNVALARKESTPLCQDTGTLSFFVDERLRRRIPREAVEKAVREATRLGYLRQNCIDASSGRSFADNVAPGSPVVHYVEPRSARPGVTLLMKGGGSENMSRQYSLPDRELGAGRDFEGVAKCVIDAVRCAKGYGCAPGIIGVCVGGDRAGGYAAAKETFLQPLGRRLRADERRLLDAINRLGIGPMGLGGATTALSLSLVSRARLPASYFVTVAYMCWALRRRTVFP